jgi:hypothetical protein
LVVFVFTEADFCAMADAFLVFGGGKEVASLANEDGAVNEVTGSE